MADRSAIANDPKFLETVYTGFEAFLKKLNALKTSDSSFCYWLSSAALNLCVNFKIVKSQDRPKYVDDLVEKVKEGLEHMEKKNLLNDLPEKEREYPEYCQKLFAYTFEENSDESKKVQSTIIESRPNLTYSTDCKSPFDKSEDSNGQQNVSASTQQPKTMRKTEYNQNFGEKLPLTSTEISRLVTNGKYVLELLMLSDLLTRLYYSNVINLVQMDLVSSKPDSDSKIDALLDILRESSLRDYNQTISCLRQSNLHHFAQIFESDGVVAKIHAHLDGPLKDVTQAEDAICAAYEKWIGSCMWTEERSRVPELGPFQVIAVRKGGSIVLYLWCEAGKNPTRLHCMVTSGHLKEPVERLLNHLLTQSQKVAVKTISMNDEDFRRLEAYFAVQESETLQGIPRMGEDETRSQPSTPFSARVNETLDKPRPISADENMKICQKAMQDLDDKLQRFLQLPEILKLEGAKANRSEK